MKRTVIVLAVFVLLALVQMSEGATLEAGWYANIRSVNIYVYDQNDQPSLTGGGYFYNTPAGTYGPFKVTAGALADRRYVSVPASVSNAGPDESLEMPLSTGLSNTTPMAYLDVWWETNYDSSQMVLQLIQRDQSGAVTVLWQQDQSQARAYEQQMAWGAMVGGLSFRVAVVPEPGSFASLLIPVLLTGAGIGLRMRTR